MTEPQINSEYQMLLKMHREAMEEQLRLTRALVLCLQFVPTEIKKKVAQMLEEKDEKG